MLTAETLTMINLKNLIKVDKFSALTKAPRTLAPYICSEFSKPESSLPDIF